MIVLGEAEAHPGTRDHLVEAMATMATATRSDEGCQGYGFYADVTRPEVLLSVEVWLDGAALEAHLTHAHTREFLDVVPDLVSGTPTMRYFDAEPTAQQAQ